MRRFNTVKHLLQLLLVALWAVSGAVVAADAPANAAADDLQSKIDQVRRIERDLKWDRYEFKELSEANKTVADFKVWAASCIAEGEAAKLKVTAALQSLGEKKTGESAEVVKQRWRQKNELASIEARLADCTALALHLASLEQKLDQQLKHRLEARMLLRGPDILTSIGRTLAAPSQWVGESWSFIRKNSWLLNRSTFGDMLWILGALLVGLLPGLWLRRVTLPAIARRSWPDTTGGRFAASLLATSSHAAPYVLTSLAAAACMGVLTYGIHPLPLFTALAYGLSLYFVANLLLRIGLDPVSPGTLFLNIPLSVAAPMAKRVRTLLFLVLVILPIMSTTVGLSLPEFARSLSNSSIRILLAINIFSVLWLFRYLGGVKQRPWFRYLLTLVLILALVADLSGYSNLSDWIFRSVFGTLLTFGLVMATARLARDFLVGVEFGSAPWARKVRRFVGLPDSDEHISGIFWVRLLITLGLWILMAWLLVLIWDLSTGAVQDIKKFVTVGFSIGSLKIIPSRILLAVITLAALIALVAWLKGLLDHQLEKSPMERGSREAAVTVFGYGGLLVAIVVGLGVAGIDFANLAIIAGALSVGIGFGLQNIVNNFVSGLILLIERPVKTGDWIVVGGTEGHVKRIRIRSTQIETFDRADVIVPNSELIASQVTNWMLRDTSGRVRIPVGVAYGSDTQKVKEILEQIANAHPEVITFNPRYAPSVLFMDFGNSSLNFELRVHIRDIDHRLQVKSDINFAIDAAFREAGIEIPFPQQDLHVKNWPGAPGK